MQKTIRISRSTSPNKRSNGAMRIVRRPVRLASPRRKNKCDAALGFGTTGTFPHHDVGGTMVMIFGATWTRRVADLIRPSKPSDRRAQTTQHTSPTTTAHTIDYHPTNTHQSRNLRPSSTTVVGWATATIDARFSLQPVRPRWKMASISPSTLLTRLLHDQTKRPLTRLMRPRPQQIAQISQSGPLRRVAKSDTRFDQPLTSRTAPLSVRFSFRLVYEKNS